MSEHSETSGRPLASTTHLAQQPEGSTLHQPTTTPTKSQSSDEHVDASKTTTSRRRPGLSKHQSSGPHAGSSRSDQRSSSPTNMTSQLPSIQYTRTGRISKAKKGLKVHNCENCGRSYTRAEHLRRHQKNHAQDDALLCEFPGCDKTFYRLDLLHRHQERHNEPEKESRQQSVFSHDGSPEVSQVSVPGHVPSSIAPPTLPPTQSHYSHLQQPVSPPHEPATLPRYIHSPFRTPQIPQLPRTPQVPSSGFNHVVRSSPSSTSAPNQKQRGSYHARQQGAIPVAIDMTPGLSWSEPYSQSPGYTTSSSGYASPIPGPGDYANMFANAPYGPSRTRTSSNASFNEPWSYASRSPVSVASTMAYTWPSSDKTTTASGITYMGTTYPMTSIPITSSIDPMTGYEHFGPKSMLQRDEEEGIVLFGEQQYGMGPIAHTYPFEQYLDYYWRLFHPTFPVVHRPTFMNNQSPMLHAAMIAVGGQYSADTSVKRKSRILHDRCVKLLERRDHEQHLMVEPDRLCDYQAMFLIEVHSQYRARRAAKTLSSHFERVYRNAKEDFRSTALQLTDMLPTHEHATMERWAQWIELATWQRLLLSCYILESQQALLLAREPLPPLIRENGLNGVDLPFSTHISLWDATTPDEWVYVAQQLSSCPRYVYDVTPEAIDTPLDSFQSSVLLAAHYNPFNFQTPYSTSSPGLDIEHLLDPSLATHRKLLTAKLVQLTPIRALLAVSGESWILSEKVSSAQDFCSMKTTLRTWVTQLWSATPADAHVTPVKEALKLSVEIMQQALKEQQKSLTVDMGSDMGIYFAGLVLWAITTAANTQLQGVSTMAAQQPHRRHSQSSVTFNNMPPASVPSTPPHMMSSYPQQQPSVTSSPTQQATAATASADCITMLSHAQITINTIKFLTTALVNLESMVQFASSIARCQTGCISLLLWIKLRLRGASIEDQSGVADTWTSRPGEGLGELLDGVTGSLERIMGRGWSGWGI